MTLFTLSIWNDLGATVSAARRALVNRNSDLGFTMPFDDPFVGARTAKMLGNNPRRSAARYERSGSGALDFCIGNCDEAVLAVRA